MSALQKALIIVLGVFAMVLAVAGLDLAIESQARSSGEATLREFAEQVVAQGDRYLDDGIDAIRALASDGAVDCSVVSRRQMALAILEKPGLKELTVLDAFGDAICNNSGLQEQIRLMSGQLPANDPSVQLELIGIRATALRALRVSVASSAGAGRIGAILPDSVFAYNYLPRPVRDAGIVRLSLADGSTIFQVDRDPLRPRRTVTADVESLPDTADWTHITLRSARYPLVVEVAVPMRQFLLEVENTKLTLNIAVVVAGLVILILGVHLQSRPRSPATDIERGLRNGEFIPYYQPIVDLKHGRLAGCEALIRWRKPDGSIVSPAHFIGLAEATGLAIPMTTALMKRCLADLGDAYRLRPRLKLSINLFDDHFDSLELVKDVEHIFEGSGIRYDQLVFEITERQPLPNLDRARVIIRKLQALGAKLALDDAGTGHGGLAYLQQLGIDVLKIDKLFVDVIGTDATSAPIVDTLAELGQRLGMIVVAEGVESFEQVKYLKEKGVDQAQGYAFAPPLPAASFLTLLEAMDKVDGSTGETLGVLKGKRIAA